MNPLVSIRVVVYNQVAFIEECLDSLLAQTYRPIEIIISDDASTDGTVDILKKYAKRHDCIKLQLNSTNLGITKNTNTGLKICKGKYIAGLGGDDIFLPEKIEKQVEYMESHPECTICYHNLDVFLSETGETLYLYNKKKPKKSGDIRVLLKYPGVNGGCSNLIRGERLRAVGFDERLSVAADYYCWTKVLGRDGQIHYLDEVLGRYRIHENNISTPKDYLSQNNLDHLITYQYLLTDYPEHSRLIIQRYVRYLLSLRRHLAYPYVAFINILVNWSPRAGLGFLVFLLSLGRTKL